jgi:hypothetical protein
MRDEGSGMEQRTEDWRVGGKDLAQVLARWATEGWLVNPAPVPVVIGGVAYHRYTMTR